MACAGGCGEPGQLRFCPHLRICPLLDGRICHTPVDETLSLLWKGHRYLDPHALTNSAAACLDLQFNHRSNLFFVSLLWRCVTIA